MNGLCELKALTEQRLLKRILIVGSPGVGKSTFAHQFARLMQLPLVALDDLYWQANWQRPDDTSWQNNLLATLNKPEWIIEGNYSKTFQQRLQYADCIIFLNKPTSVCLYNFAKRSIKRWLGNKSSLPINMKNDDNYRSTLSIDFAFISLILFFKWKIKPAMLDAILASNKPLIYLNSSQISQSLNRFTMETAAL